MMENLDSEEFGRQMDKLEAQFNMTDKVPRHQHNQIVNNNNPRHAISTQETQ